MDLKLEFGAIFAGNLFLWLLLILVSEKILNGYYPKGREPFIEPQIIEN